RATSSTGGLGAIGSSTRNKRPERRQRIEGGGVGDAARPELVEVPYAAALADHDLVRDDDSSRELQVEGVAAERGMERGRVCADIDGSCCVVDQTPYHAR